MGKALRRAFRHRYDGGETFYRWLTLRAQKEQKEASSGSSAPQ